MVETNRRDLLRGAATVTLHFNLMRYALLAVALACAASAVHGRTIAPTPPMGWNSWDAFGFTIGESDYKANAAVLATLEPYGWKYAVIDEGWYMENPLGSKLEERKYVLDANGLLMPAPARFPSATGGQGLKPLADWVHAQGLKFGIHIVRGIPKQAVRDNLPIANSAFRAADAADRSDTCPWDDGNYGVADNAAGQAYYDSMMRLYAAWGLDFIKVDCIAAHPYKPGEIRQIATAIERSRRPIVLSLSPGPTPLEHAEEISRQAQMWRIADDLWDGWVLPHQHPQDEFPNGLLSAFDNLAKWSRYAGPGHWPDADMLPFGSLTPHPGWGEARQSRLTQDEERSEFTLWAIARSPLILGANLTGLDDFTRSLLTNRNVLELNQRARVSGPVTDLPLGFEHVRVWRSELQAVRGGRPAVVVALFNLANEPVSLHATGLQLGWRSGARLRDLWTDRVATSDEVSLTLPPHGCAVYRVE
jgi:alpha-galactosidase